MSKPPRKVSTQRPDWNDEEAVAKLVATRPIGLVPVFDFNLPTEGQAIKQAMHAIKQAEEQAKAGNITKEDAIKQAKHAIEQLKPGDVDATEKQALKRARAGDFGAIAFLLREIAFAIEQENAKDLLQKIALGIKPAPDDFDSPTVLLRDFARGFANHGKACELAAAILEGEFKPPQQSKKQGPKPKSKEERSVLSVMPDAERAYAEIVGYVKFKYPDISDKDISDRAFRYAAEQSGIDTESLATYWHRSESDRHRLSPRPEIPDYSKLLKK